MVIAAPVQKTLLIPSGFAVAQDDSPVGTFGRFVTTSREYLLLQARTIWPTASVTISGIEPQQADEDAVDEAHTSTPTPRRRGSRRGACGPSPPRSRRPGSRRAEITPGVERSMPACMTTSIWPSAAMARTVAIGRMYENEVCCSASGAANAAMTRRARGGEPHRQESGQRPWPRRGERSNRGGQRTVPSGRATVSAGRDHGTILCRSGEQCQ